MARLPTVGGDSGNWGTVLNEYLATAHNADGTLKLDVKTIADLKSINVASLTDKQQALVAGYYAPGDGGGGQFYFDASASDADNGGTIIAPTAGSGRWKRIYSGAVNVKWFGAKGDGVTDDTGPVQAALTSCGVSGGHVVLPEGIYKCGPLSTNVPASCKYIVSGYGATILSTNAGVTGTKSFYFSKGADSEIEFYGITVDHTTEILYTEGNGNTETSCLVANAATSAKRFVAKDVRIESSWWAGIRPYKFKEVIVDGCSVSNCRGTGIFGSAHDSVTVVNNFVTRTSDDGIFFGRTVALGGEGCLTYSGNTVTNALAKGVACGGYRLINIIGNVTDKTMAYGVGVESGQVDTDVWETCHQITISNNSISFPGYNSHLGNSTRYGVSIRVADGATPEYIKISGNTITDAPAHGIRSYTATFIDVSLNTVEAALAGLYLGNGTQTTGMAVIAGNKFITADANAIMACYTSRMLVSSNSLGGSTAALLLDNCSNVYIDPDNVYDGTGSLVSQTNSTNVSWARAGNPTAYNAAITAAADAMDPPRIHMRPVPNSALPSMEVTLLGTLTLSGTVSNGVPIGNLGGSFQPATNQYCPVSIYDGTSYFVATLQVRASNNGELHLYGHPNPNITRIFLNGVRYRFNLPT